MQKKTGEQFILQAKSKLKSMPTVCTNGTI